MRLLGFQPTLVQRMLIVTCVTGLVFLLAINLNYSLRRMVHERYRDELTVADENRERFSEESISTDVNASINHLLDLINYTNNENATIISRQTVRHALLNQVCSHFTDKQRSTEPDWSDFIVDERRKYIFCKVEKVGCTSWKRTLLALTGEVPNAEKLQFYKVHSRFTFKHLTTLKAYKPAERKHKLKTYYKFFFTRDPFARLVSAYRGKILRDPAYKELKNRISRGGSGKKRALFRKFVRFIVHKKRTGHGLNIHWRPQNNICRPCLINYDFIGRYETLYSDADYVLNLIADRLQLFTSNETTISESDNAETKVNRVQFPRSDPDNKRKNSGYLVGDMFATLDKEDIEDLYKLYDLDFRLYGYRSKV